MMTKQVLLSGNEAIARGAYEAGAKVGTGYPGTPSTEILENLSKYDGVNCEWSVNEKVALEVGFGSCLAGQRTIVTMKHVGLNVAADPLFTSSYIGVKGGLVIIVADDPDMHSSQNEQDSRHYARASQIPMLEPSNSQEAKNFVKLAFELSEKYDTPVFIRSVTRISHSKTIVDLCDPIKNPIKVGFKRNIMKYVMIPAFARIRHKEVLKRMAKLELDCNTFSINKKTITDKKIGIITSGIIYEYVKEVLPDVSILKLGIVYPLPMDLIRKFCESIDTVYITEEVDPFIETEIKAKGITNLIGKDKFPLFGELSPDIIYNTVMNVQEKDLISIDIEIPKRPPKLCPGCPHHQIFNVLNRLGLTVTGDIGCYTLGVLPPYSAMDTCLDMGASVTVSQGIELAEGKDFKNNTVAVIGDSTFAHSGITGLINAVYNKRHSLVIVLDNSTTAMTGMQPNPLSGETINGDTTYAIDYQKLAEAVGVKTEQIRIINAYKEEIMEDTVKELLATKELAFMVIKGPCVLLKRKRAKQKRGKA